MSLVSYNGIVLTHTRLVNYQKVAETVGPQNLARVQHTVRVAGVFNPAVTSYVRGPADASAAFFRPGQTAPQTEEAVQWALMQPRKTFAFLVGGVAVTFGPRSVTRNGTVRVRLPLPPNVQTAINLLGVQGIPTTQELPAVLSQMGNVDVANGPMPGPVVVTENIGDKTFFVDMTFTTWVNDAVPSHGNQKIPQGFRQNFPTPPLVAHEYSMMQAIDADFTSQRWVEGRAVFRSDVMDVLNLFPDQLRRWLGHPIPARHRRSRIEVWAESDALTLRYRFCDQERYLLYDENVFTRVECHISDETHTLGLESMIRSGTMAAANTIAPVGAIGRTLGGVLGAPLSALPFVGRGLHSAARAIGGLAGILGVGYLAARFAGVPVRNFHQVGRFWGHLQRFRGAFEADAAAQMVALRTAYGIQGGINALLGPLIVPTSIPIPNPFPAIPGAGAVAARLGLGGPTLNIPLPVVGGLSVQLADIHVVKRADLSGMFVELEQSWVGSRLQTLAGRFAARPGMAVDPAGALAGQVLGGFDVGDLDDAPSEPRPILPDPMRGTALGAVVANALRDSSDLWGQVQDPPNVTDAANTRNLNHNGPVRGITLP